MKYSVFSLRKSQELIDIASRTERLRTHTSLHHSHDDPVQKVVIALIQGTYIPPHYHEHAQQWELFQIFFGEVDLYIFDKQGIVQDIIRLGGECGNYFVQIEPNTCHTLVCRSESAIIMEVKEGPFDETQAKVMPDWSYAEDYDVISREKIITALQQTRIGEKFVVS